MEDLVSGVFFLVIVLDTCLPFCYRLDGRCWLSFIYLNKHLVHFGSWLSFLLSIFMPYWVVVNVWFWGDEENVVVHNNLLIRALVGSTVVASSRSSWISVRYIGVGNVIPQRSCASVNINMACLLTYPRTKQRARHKERTIPIDYLELKKMCCCYSVE